MKLTRRSRPFLEHLETRDCPSLTVSLMQGNLTITGAPLGNLDPGGVLLREIRPAALDARGRKVEHVSPVRIADVERAPDARLREPPSEHEGGLMAALEDGLVGFLDVECPGRPAQPPVLRASEKGMPDRKVGPGLDTKNSAQARLHPGGEKRFETRRNAPSQRRLQCCGESAERGS